jgi:ribosomal protein L24E
MSDRCSWCGADVEPGDGFRAYEPAGSRQAVFCRLEHVVPWAIRGAWWEAGEPVDDPRLSTCSFCGDELDEAHVLLVRTRGEHHVPDGFCTVEHLLEWAKAGGRYGP